MPLELLGIFLRQCEKTLLTILLSYMCIFSTFADSNFYVVSDNYTIHTVNTATFAQGNLKVNTNIGTIGGIALSSDGQYLYVLGRYRGVMIKKDIVTGEELSITISLNHPDDRINDLSVSPDGKYVYVKDDANNLHVVSAIDNKWITSIPTSSVIRKISVTPDNRLIGVLHTNTIDFVDTASLAILKTYTFTDANVNLRSMVFTDNNTAYIVDKNLPQLIVLDISDLMNPVERNPIALTAGDEPVDLVLSSNGQFIYVVNNGSNTVAAVDITGGQVLTGSGSVGAAPTSIEITPDGQHVYIAGNSGVYVISTLSNAVLIDPIFPLAVGTVVSNISALSYSVPLVTAATRVKNSFIGSHFYNIITWTKPAYLSIDHYEVCKNREFTDCIGPIAAGSELKLEDHDVIKGHTYTYYVLAKSQFGILSIGKKSIAL